MGIYISCWQFVGESDFRRANFVVDVRNDNDKKEKREILQRGMESLCKAHTTRKWRATNIGHAPHVSAT